MWQITVDACMVIGRTKIHAFLSSTTMPCFAVVTAWARLRAYSSVREPTLESSPLIALVCAAGCTAVGTVAGL